MCKYGFMHAHRHYSSLAGEHASVRRWRLHVARDVRVLPYQYVLHAGAPRGLATGRAAAGFWEVELWLG